MKHIEKTLSSEPSLALCITSTKPASFLSTLPLTSKFSNNGPAGSKAKMNE